jgi:demethylmenaquinone methyltransferase/2-methoxy-6-polyprenyl-1,4-benzoquinol methylase
MTPSDGKNTGREKPGESIHFGYREVSEAEKSRLVQDHFDTIAARYDVTNTVMSLGSQHRWKKAAVAMLDLQPGERVLDVCGGTGDLALRAAKAVGPAGGVVLYDFNRAMIEVGRRKVSVSPYRDRILPVQGDAEKISLAGETFDAAMVGFGVRNLAHLERGFEEMHRVLKPGGRMMCLDFSQPRAAWFRKLYDFYSFHVMPLLGRMLAGSREAYTYLPESIRIFPGPEELGAILERIGFDQVRYRLMTGGIAVILVGRKAC